MEVKIIQVGTAEFAIGSSGEILETKGIGSCVVICLYDRNKKIGALAHIMLARCENETLNPLRFVDTGLKKVLKKLEQLGVEKADLTADLIGGASMFPEIDDYLKLGPENIKAAEDWLKSMDITIKNKEVGGNIGRSVRFILETGEVEVTTK